jgi:hypothetical protein
MYAMSKQTLSVNMKPHIFLLSLDHEFFEDKIYRRLLDSLMLKATVQQAYNSDAALDYLNANTSRIIIITDLNIIYLECLAVLKKVIFYIYYKSTAILVC